jgi:hypothetical protein
MKGGNDMKAKLGGLILLLVVLLGLAIVLLNKENDDFIKSCQEAGFTKEYCEAHK